MRSAACVLATLLVMGAAVASSEGSGDEPEEGQCLNIAKDEASEFGVVVTREGAYGVSVASPEPGRGLTVHVFIVPEFCEIGLAPLTSALSEDPIYRPGERFPLLP